MKISISLDEDLLKWIDEYAAEMFMKRSGVISMACVQLRNASEGMKAVRDMTVSMRKLADSKGDIDEETLKEIEDFERISKMLMGGK